MRRESPNSLSLPADDGFLGSVKTIVEILLCLGFGYVKKNRSET